MLLKDGKIVLEKYFGTFTADSIWYWASAGKTLTSLLVGMAQEEGKLQITDTSSKYLGEGWTDCSKSDEEKITIRHQLTMTSGLNDGVPDNHCTLDTCNTCLATPGTRWAYHNSPYTLLEKVVSNATGVTFNAYTTTKIKSRTGMTGMWYKSNYDNVFVSRVRSMARFGLLIQNNCIWNGDTLFRDTAYLTAMTSTSQNINPSYGYLWWLNGKSTFRVPGSQVSIPGPLAPNAPADMYSGIGKDGQLLSICKSKGLIMIRMGEQPTSFGEVPFLILDKIWERLNKIMCSGNAITEAESARLSIYPNPVSQLLKIEGSASGSLLMVRNLMGSVVLTGEGSEIDVQSISPGIYFLEINAGGIQRQFRFVKE